MMVFHPYLSQPHEDEPDQAIQPRVSSKHRPVSQRTEPIAKIGSSDLPARQPVNTSPRPTAQAMSLDDPRWALAVQTHQRLQGAILRPYDRAILLKMGQTLGLNPFESNLVITITQDQARRGLGPEAGIPSLQMLTAPTAKTPSHRTYRTLFFWCTLTFILEIILIIKIM